MIALVEPVLAEQGLELVDVEHRPEGRLLHVLTKMHVMLASFVSDSEIQALVNVDRAEIEIHIFKRRYAPTLIGYATRPEVLMLLIVSIALLVRLIMSIRTQLRRRAAA